MDLALYICLCMLKIGYDLRKLLQKVLLASFFWNTVYVCMYVCSLHGSSYFTADPVMINVSEPDKCCCCLLASFGVFHIVP